MRINKEDYTNEEDYMKEIERVAKKIANNVFIGTIAVIFLFMFSFAIGSANRPSAEVRTYDKQQADLYKELHKKRNW